MEPDIGHVEEGHHELSSHSHSEKSVNSSIGILHSYDHSRRKSVDSDHFDNQNKTKWQIIADLRKKMYIIFTEADHSKLSRVIFILTVFVTIFSVSVLCFETITIWHNNQEEENFWNDVEMLFTAYLGTDLLLRFICYPGKPHYKFFTSIGMLNWADLLGTLPFFIKLMERNQFRGTYDPVKVLTIIFNYND